jgi:tetratricopeptide (TPR) repeat protein
MCLGRLGQPENALASFARAIEADPRNLVAMISKADTFAELGRHAEAVTQFDKALAVDATNVAAWCNRGLALEALGRDADAAESFERVLALNPNLAEVHFNLANALLRLQRYDDAAGHYQRAIALRPNLTPAFVNLGRALVSLLRWQDAADIYAQALKLDPRSALVHDAIGYVLWNLERYQDALASFDMALAIDPNYAAALNKKGRLLYVLGRLDESRALIERAIAADPGKSGNHLVLSEMKRFVPGDPQLAAMEKLLPGIESRPVQDQVDLHFALGKAYADIGNHEPSFRHLLEGNALMRGRFVYDERAVIDSLDRIGPVFTSELLRSKAGHGNPSIQPIFIVGMPRSGTTLIEQILASHPQVYGAGERQNFKQAFIKVVGAADYPEVVRSLTSPQFDAIGSAYLAGMTAPALAAARFTDKLPANFVYVGLIRLALPNARIIHVRRDPIDTCLSCFSILFRSTLNFTYDLGELGRFYLAYERLMAHWRTVLPEGAMLDVQYEDVVADIETQARRILAHCGLPWDEACLAFHKADRPVNTASAAQVRQPIYGSSVGRWHAYRDQLQPLLEALGQPV